MDTLLIDIPDGHRLEAQQCRAAAPAGHAVLLHGGGQTRHSWQGATRRLAAAGWSALAYDARGHGGSDWRLDGHYQIDGFVADLRQVLAALPPKPVLIGASLGGLSALIAEGETPGLSRALVMIDIAPRMNPEEVERIRAFMRGAPEGFASVEEAAVAISRYNPARPRPQGLDGLRRNLRQRGGRWHWHWDPQLVEQLSDPLHDRLLAQRLPQAAAAVEVPVLLIRGGRSKMVSDEAVTELLTLLPDLRCVDIGDTGHMVAGDDNDAFTTAVLSFLGSLRTERTAG